MPVKLLLSWTPAQSSLSEVRVMFCECYLFIYFYGRLMLRPRSTEVAKLLHMVDLECEYRIYHLDFFPVLLKLQGGPKSDEIWHIFRPRSQTFCFHARTRQNIVILKKMLSTDGCSTRVPGLVNFGLQTPEIHASYYKICRNLHSQSISLERLNAGY